MQLLPTCDQTRATRLHTSYIATYFIQNRRHGADHRDTRALVHVNLLTFERTDVIVPVVSQIYCV